MTIIRTEHALAGWLPGACAALLAACAQDPAPVPKAVFILVDGIPADVIESVATPGIDAIAAEGGYTRAYVGGEIGGESESPTVSAVGYMSLLTGTWAHKHNVVDNAVEAPDYRYWDIFRIAKANDPALRTALFSTWTDNRTKLLGDGLEAAGGKKLDYAFDGLELGATEHSVEEEIEFIRAIDRRVAAEAARYIRAEGPDLSWVYLQHTDDVAHEFGDGPELAAAVREMDALVAAIRAAVSERQAHFDEDWLVIVTTDHGRDAETGRDHGGHSPRERTTWIATNSRRLNGRFADEPAIVDILPSIAAHLGIGVPDPIVAALDGSTFIE
ncbi:MAG: alkaline phosphatase family protein [Woeseiaceae bacterium]|nr:alkaline phosphatase family protein [Woeseiaceae bacterium]